MNDDRKQRLAEQLRANLRGRKAQARARLAERDQDAMVQATDPSADEKRATGGERD